MSADRTEKVLFQSHYGSFQARYLWFLPVLGTLGLIGIPVGLFWNKGWKLGPRPLDPGTAMAIIEIFSMGALLLAAALAWATWLRRKSPQRVALTESALIVPKGMFSKAELRLPRSEIKVRVYNAGFVKQLEVRHNRRKILLSSALFPSNADFDRLASLVK